MKILFVIDSLGTGGAERSTGDLWYFLREKGLDVTILALGLRKEGIQTEILNEKFKVHFLKSNGFFAQSSEILTFIKNIKPDIVHSVLLKSNLRTRFARLRRSFIHIETLVNCSYDQIRLKDPKINAIAFYYYKFIDRLTSGLTNHFQAITKVVKDHYHSELKIADEKITVIYRGRDENRFIEARSSVREKYRKEFNLPPDSTLVVHVGRQEYQKGHLTLLRAIQQLKLDKPVVFLFLGREGNATGDIRSFLDGTVLPAQIIWAGHRADVQQVLAAADLFVFPSLYEGLGGALIEAQAAALPILCTDIPVLREVILTDRNALLHKNEEELAANLQRLLEDENLRKHMGESGLTNFRSKFLLAKINEQTLEFYNKAVSQVNP